MTLFPYTTLFRSYDGMSVAALIYICVGILIIVFDIAKFQTWTKLKNLFAVKKENKEELTNFEKSQMKVLNIKVDDETKKNNEQKKEMFRFLAIAFIVFGLVLLLVSLPFCF